MVLIRVAAVDELLGRAGLPGDRVAGHAGAARRPALGHRRHHLGEFRRRLARYGAPDDAPLGLHAPAVAGHGADEARREELAAVGHRGYRGRHLQRGDRDLVAHRDRGDGALGEGVRAPHEPGVLGRKVPGLRAAEAETVDVAGEPPRPEPQAHQNGPDVAGLDDHVRERELAVGGEVRDAVPPDADVAGADVEDLVPFDDAFLEGRRGRDDLERRPGFVDVLDGPVAPLRPARLGEGVGVERRLAGEGQDLAAPRVEHHDGPGVGVVGADRGAQLALDEVLQVLVDGQLDGRAGRRGPVDAAERPVARVRVDQGLPGVARDLGFVGRFDPAQALVVDADVADEVRRQLAVGVVAPVLGEESDAVQPQGRHAPGLGRRRLPPDVGEGAAPPDALLQLVPALAGAVVQRAADRARRRRQIVVGDARRGGVDGAAVGVDPHAVQPQGGHAPGLLGGGVALQHGVGPAASEAALDGVPVRLRAVVERAAQGPRGGRRIADLGRDGVDRVGVDAVGEHAPVPVQDLAALGMHLHRPPLLGAGPLDQLGVLHDLQVDQLGLDGDDPEGEHAGPREDAAPHDTAPVAGRRRAGLPEQPRAAPPGPNSFREPAHSTPPAASPPPAAPRAAPPRTRARSPVPPRSPA